MTSARRIGLDGATLAFAIVLGALLWLRVVALRNNPLDLYFDEAQYWMWSRTFEWGYFTKPPMVAWAIGATTALFGDAEWAVRLAAPLAHGVAAICVFALARVMYGAWAGFWAGLGWLLLPGVFLSSTVISTDALLLPMWSFALLAMWRLTTTRSWGWAIALGLAVGLGAMAKYAMFYFIPCAAWAAWRLAPVRQGLAQGRGIVAALLAIAVVTPNIVWNAQHDFATAQHTAANANLDLTNLFHFDEVFEFLTNQAGVIGPIVLVVLVWLLWRAAQRGPDRPIEDRFLISFVLPPLVFVSIIAFISRANANWAAVAYPAIVVWISGALMTSVAGRRTLAASALVNALIGSAVIAVPLLADPALANRVKGVRVTRAWQETADEIARRAMARPDEQPFTALLVDDRETYFQLNYYWRDLRRDGAPLPPVRMWLLLGEAHNSAEAMDPMRPEEGGRVLVVHSNPQYLPFLAGDFTAFRTVEPMHIPLGGEYSRDFELSVGEGFTPAPRDDAFRARLQGRRG